MKLLLGLSLGYMICEIINRLIISRKYIKKSTVKSKINKLPGVKEKFGLFKNFSITIGGETTDIDVEFKVVKETDDMVKIKVINVCFKNSEYLDAESSIINYLNDRWFDKNNTKIKWLTETKSSVLIRRKNILKSILNG